MKQKTVISVVKMGSKGMVVTFNGGAAGDTEPENRSGTRAFQRV